MRVRAPACDRDGPEISFGYEDDRIAMNGRLSKITGLGDSGRCGQKKEKKETAASHERPHFRGDKVCSRPQIRRICIMVIYCTGTFGNSRSLAVRDRQREPQPPTHLSLTAPRSPWPTPSPRLRYTSQSSCEPFVGPTSVPIISSFVRMA